MSRSFYLTTFDLHRLELACAPLWKFARDIGDGGVYVVGSVWERADFRDVDVRMMLSDEAFDRLFGHTPELWSLFCYAVSCQLRADTGLPVDFQVQRQTEANEQHGGKPRNPVGLGHRDFAGLGDATRFGRPDRSEAVALLDSLPKVCREARTKKGLSLRSAAKEIGCSFSTISRCENGDGGLNLSSALAILRWAHDSQRPASPVGGEQQ